MGALHETNLTCDDFIDTSLPDFSDQLAMRISDLDAHLLILEVSGKGRSCIACATLIRAVCPSIPIICLAQSVEDKCLINKLRNAYILPKPFHSADLRTTVTDVIATEQAQR